jgi:hypothetical protein
MHWNVEELSLRFDKKLGSFSFKEGVGRGETKANN